VERRDEGTHLSTKSISGVDCSIDDRQSMVPIGTTQSLLNEWTHQRLEWAEPGDGSPFPPKDAALVVQRLASYANPVVVKILLPVPTL
jgi:hypothetical protein